MRHAFYPIVRWLGSVWDNPRRQTTGFDGGPSAVSPAAEPLQESLPSFARFSLPNGLSYELSIGDSEQPDAYERSIRSDGGHDSVWRFTTHWVRPGDVFFDLGANIGVISIPVAVKGAVVHAFELLDANVRHLARAAEKNKLSNLSIILGAAWDRGGTVGFGGTSAWGNVWTDSLVSIATIVIDDYVSQKAIDHVDFIKIDIEGSEKRALIGALALIKRDHPDIVIEGNALTCGTKGYSIRDLLQFLGDHGYNLYRFQQDKICPWSVNETQEIVYTDYFATTKMPEEIMQRSGWEISPLTVQDKIENIIVQDLQGEIHMQYVLVVKDRLPEAVLTDRRVAALVEQWSLLSPHPALATLQLGSG